MVSITLHRTLLMGGTLLLSLLAACAGGEGTVAQQPQQPAAASQPAAAAAAADPESPAAAVPAPASASMPSAMAEKAPSAIAAWQFEQEPDSGMPVYGGFYRQAADDAPTLNVYDVAPTSVLQMVSSIYDTLMVFEWRGGDPVFGPPVGGLAESWEVSPDSTQWTFHLRDNVKFHDGTPMTSADVKATLDFLISPGQRRPPGSNYTRPFIESVSAPDPQTVVLKLIKPTGRLLDNLTITYTMIAPKSHMPGNLDWFNIKENGTGPFRLTKWERGVSWTVERVDDFWIDGLPYLDGKKYFVIGDSSARIAAFETKRIDEIAQPVVSPNQLRSLIDRYGDQLRLVEKPGGSYHYVIWNATKPPFDDVRVRKALYLWLDRPAFMDKAQQGVGFLGEWVNPAMFPPHGTPYSDLREKHPAFRQDKTEARQQALQLLAEAGYTREALGQIKVRVLPRFARAQILVSNQVLVAQLKELGLDAELVTKESLAATKDLLDGNYEATMYQGGTAGGIDGILNRYLASTGQRNYSGFTNPDLDALIAILNASVEPQARVQALRDVDEYLQKGETVTPFLFYLAGNVLQWPWGHGVRYVVGGGVNIPSYQIWLDANSPGR